MQSSQLRIEEVTSDNIVERELQPPKPPKRKKKKVPFAVWWELYATEEQKNPAENIKQQDASLEIEKESIAKAVEAVDQSGDRSTSESKSNENQVPFKSWSEEHVPVEQRISARIIEKQNDSLLSAEESIARVEETINTSEKEQPSESREQPRKTRHNKKKKIPFNIWLEKHAPAESTGPQDASPASEKASISELQETDNLAEKQESFQSCAENATKQDPSLPQEGDQADSLKKEICTDETPLVTEQNFISIAQESLDQQEEEQRPKIRRIKKKKIPFHIWLAKQAPPESTGPQDAYAVTEKTSISKLQETNNLAEKQESFQSCVEIVNKQDTSLPEEVDQADSLKKEISADATPLVTDQDFLFKAQETLDQQEEEQRPKIRRIKKKKIPFHIWLAKQAPPESTGPQDAYAVTEKTSISELQETNNLAEKEESVQSCVENVNKQDTSLPEEIDQADYLKKESCAGETPLVTDQDFISKAQETLDQQEEEQRPKIRRIKKKKIPFHIWLAKQAPPESTGPQDALPVSEKASISKLQETINLAEKQESFQSCVEIVNKQDTSLPEEVDQEDFLKNKSFAEEPVLSTAQMVSKNKSISQSETKVDQKVKKQTAKTKRIRRTPLLWKCFPESNACVDLTFFTENSDVNNSPSYQAALPCSDKKTFWKVLPDSEPCIELNFLAEHIEDQDVSVLAKHGKQVGSMEKQPYSKHTLIATTNQTQCTCQGKCKEPELGSVELQKYLMRQLDEMFDINRKLRAKLNYQNDLLRKVLSEQRPNRKSTGWGHVWNE